MTTQPDRPDWVKIGARVRVHEQHWGGVIVDIAISEAGLLRVCIDSPKAVFHGHLPEWLDFLPEQIRPDDIGIIERDVETYGNRIKEKLDRLQTFEKGESVK